MRHDGRLNLSTLRVLAPYLTPANHNELLVEATRKSKRYVEEMVARRFPKTVETSIRKLPAPRAAATAAPPPASPISAAPPNGSCPAGSDRGGERPVLAPAPAPSPARRAVTPMAEDVFLIKLAAKREMVDRLRYAQDLLGHAVPRGEVTEVFDRALVALIADLEKKRFGKRAAGSSAASARHRERGRADGRRADHSHSRSVPVEVRRLVWARDGGRCAYVAPDGRRCTATRFLEFHHIRPYAAGGEATVENIALRCHAHNQYEADVFFGPSRPAMGEWATGEWATGESGMGDRAVRERGSTRPGAGSPLSG